MSSTITTGKRAAAFRTAAGATIYALFEATYESNCFPQVPHWSCILFGDLKVAVERIFWHASACEGGMLRNRNGSITPEGYIRGWLKELAAPVEFPDRLIELKIGSDRLYDVIPSGNVELLKEHLPAIGRKDLLDKLINGESVTVSVHNDADVLLALYGPRRMAPWRVLSIPYQEVRRPDLGYLPAPTKKFDVQVPVLFKIGGNEHLFQRPNGTWYCAGWAYSIIGRFITDLWESELSEPGSYYKRIRAYRDAVENAPDLQFTDVKVVVDSTVVFTGEHAKYQRASIAEFAERFPVTKTETGFEVYPTSDNLYLLTNLPNECSSWIPSVQSDPAPIQSQIPLLSA